jgi:hypothetical protein
MCAVDQYPLVLDFHHQPFQLFDHAAGVLAVGATAYAEVVVWLGNFQLIEEHVRHVRIVVLAGMYDNFLNIGAVFFEGSRYDSGFNELRTGTDDG